MWMRRDQSAGEEVLDIHHAGRYLCCGTEESGYESSHGGFSEKVQRNNRMRWLETVCQVHKTDTAMARLYHRLDHALKDDLRL